jgi:hypothetical protein
VQKPIVDFLSKLPAQSALVLLFLIQIPFPRQLFKYLNILLMASKWEVLGVCMNLLTWLTANDKSGLVTVKYINFPTSFWYRLISSRSSSSSVLSFTFMSTGVDIGLHLNLPVSLSKSSTYCATLFRVPHRPEKKLDDELRKKDMDISLSVHWGIFI